MRVQFISKNEAPIIGPSWEAESIQGIQNVFHRHTHRSEFR